MEGLYQTQRIKDLKDKMEKQAIEKAFAKKIAEKKKRAMIEKEADRLVSHAKSNAKKKSHAKAMGKAGIKAKNARSGAGMSARRK